MFFQPDGQPREDGGFDAVLGYPPWDMVRADTQGRGRSDKARTVIETSAKKRLAEQIQPDGRQPEELKRTRAWSYSVMNLEGWFTLALLADEAGVDLWHYRTRDGRSLQAALDYLVPFAEGAATWPYPQITPFGTDELAPLLRQAAVAWKSDRYAALADRLQRSQGTPRFDMAALERGRILPAADALLAEKPVTVTASRAPRSAGGIHDFFSEGDYWWPDPANPAGPYVRRDGRSNPVNFVGHRQALMGLSRIVPAPAAAWVLTGEARYSEHAARHLRAWFQSTRGRAWPPTCATRMPFTASRPGAASASSTPSTSSRWPGRSWGADPPPETFVFNGVAAWPETLVLYGIVSSLPLHWTIVHPRPDSWYPLGFSLNPPYVWLYGTGYGVEESRPLVASTPYLAVSPTVVTGQMTVRLQPVGASRAVVEIHDATGNVIRSLSCTAGASGTATATWNREDDFGRLVPEGVYFCRYAAAGAAAVRKVLVTH